AKHKDDSDPSPGEIHRPPKSNRGKHPPAAQNPLAPFRPEPSLGLFSPYPRQSARFPRKTQNWSSEDSSDESIRYKRHAVKSLRAISRHLDVKFSALWRIESKSRHYKFFLLCQRLQTFGARRLIFIRLGQFLFRP